jgi:hypothetical protein
MGHKSHLYGPTTTVGRGTNYSRRSIDEGACFELGYAFALGKTCVGLKTDSRTLFPFGDNPMIEAALRHIFRDEADLFTWLAGYSVTA